MQRDAGYYECQAFNKHAVETKVGGPLKFLYFLTVCDFLASPGAQEVALYVCVSVCDF